MRQSDRLTLFGLHAVAAALANPARRVFELKATRNALARLGDAVRARPDLAMAEVAPRELDRVLGADAVHQGVALEVAPLPARAVLDLVPADGAPAVLLALDQVEDPRNVGAILRSAAALGAAGIILPQHGSALLGGVCAKAASGALDLVPVATVANLSQALQALKAEGFWSLGLDGAADRPLRDAPAYARAVLVLGAEGKGLRRLTAETCDLLVGLPIDPRMESLNVAVAAAIALYELRRGGEP